MQMLMPVTVILAKTLMLVVYAFDAVAHAAANDDANVDAKMPNVARFLVGAYVVLLMSPWLPMMMLLRQLLGANA
jgi:hypothetical protein